MWKVIRSPEIRSALSITGRVSAYVVVTTWLFYSVIRHGLAFFAVFLTLIVGASAEDFVIRLDRGASIDSGKTPLDYITHMQRLESNGTRVVIDGPCWSACYYYTSVTNACATEHGMLHMHAAVNYNWTREQRDRQNAWLLTFITRPSVVAYLEQNPLPYSGYLRVRADKLLPRC